MTSEELWQQREDAAHWTAVEDELAAMLVGVKAANLKRRHSLGQAILQIYTMLRRLVKKKEHSDLIPFFENAPRDTGMPLVFRAKERSLRDCLSVCNARRTT